MKYFVFLLLFCTSLSRAQSRTVEKNNMQWIQYYTNTHFSDEWTLQVDAGYRLQNSFENKVGYIARIAMGFQQTDKLSFAAGIGYLAGYQDDIFTRNEIRPHQEMNFKTYWNELKISNRLRIEERFLLNNFKPNSFNVRFRYSLTFKWNLWNWNEDLNGFDLVFGNEIFLQAWNKNISTAFQQNRVMISPTLVLKNLSFGLNFTNQFTAISEGKYRKSHLIWLQIRHDFLR